jgi:polar amino acid transport system substrate-binding protein
MDNLSPVVDTNVASSAQATDIVNTPDQQSSNAPTKGKGKVIIFIVFCATVLFVGLMSLITYKNQQSSQQEAQVPSSMTIVADTLTIGTDSTYPPMESVDAHNELVGFDIDLGMELAKGMGLKAVFKSYPWDDLFPALQQGKIDIILSSVTINDERKKLYIFSDPYFNAGQVIVMKKNEQPIVLPEGLMGKKVGVQKETTSEVEALKYASDSGVFAYPDYEQAAASLSAGTIHAIVIDLPAAKGLVDANSSIVITSDPFTKEYYGVMMKKGNSLLQNKVNSRLSTLKEQGTLDTIKQKWFK